MYDWVGENFRVKVLYSRAGVATQILISTFNWDLIVDVGDGVVRDLLNLNYDFNRLIGVAITHGHYDHMGGLWSLLGFLRMIGRRGDLNIIMPLNCVEVKGLVECFSGVYGKTLPYKIVLRELGDGGMVDLNGIIIEGFKVLHRGSIRGFGVLDFIPALGYSIRCGGERIVISGDTGMCDSLLKYVEDADLAVIEATLMEKTVEMGEVHLSLEEALEIGGRAKNYILIHRRI